MKKELKDLLLSGLMTFGITCLIFGMIGLSIQQLRNIDATKGRILVDNWRLVALAFGGAITYLVAKFIKRD